MPYNQNQRRGNTVDGGPPVFTQQQWRRDPVYRNTMNDLQTNFRNYLSQNTTNKNQLAQDFDLTTKRLGQDQNLAVRNQNEDYAARGLYGSGMYGQANEELLGKYADQLADAGTSNQRNAGQLVTDLGNARTLLNQQKQAARLAAVRRMAEKYGIR